MRFSLRPFGCSRVVSKRVFRLASLPLRQAMRSYATGAAARFRSGCFLLCAPRAPFAVALLCCVSLRSQIPSQFVTSPDQGACLCVYYRQGRRPRSRGTGPPGRSRSKVPDRRPATPPFHTLSPRSHAGSQPGAQAARQPGSCGQSQP